MPIYTNAKTGMPQPGLDAAREGRTFCQKMNVRTGLDAQLVITDAGMLKAMEHGTRYIIRSFYMHVSTISDWVVAEIGVTQHADGGGTFTPLSPLFHIATGNVQDGADPHQTTVDPPIAITVADGGAFTIRALANDASAELTFAINGWEEAI